MGEYPSGMETSGVHARGKLSQREKGLELESFLFLPEYPPRPRPVPGATMVTLWILTLQAGL